MAINGTLSDIEFVALLQFPNSSHKTGLLSVTSSAGKADFYYDSGKLIHASFGNKTGRDVLVDVVDWTEGQFTFKSDIKAPEVTIQKNLHQTLMWALKERDERKKDKSDNDAKASRIDAEMSGKLEELLKIASDIMYICIVSSQGYITASTECEDEFLLEIEPFLELAVRFVEVYPEKITGKSFIEDRKFSIAIAGLNEKQTIFIAAGQSMTLGRLSMALGKISRELKVD